MTREEAVELAGDEDLLFADGFDDCLIGVVQVFNKTVALYDRKKCIESIVSRSKPDSQEAQDQELWVDTSFAYYEAAEEFFEFNVVGAYVGPYTPAFAILGGP